MSAVANVIRLEIESDLEILADKFSAELADTAVFRAADDDERWSIEAGYIDAIEQAAVVTQLRVGPVQEWLLRCTPEGMTTVVKGMDRAADLLKGQIRRRFIRGTRAATLQSVTGNEIEPITEETGTFLASQVAQLVCGDLGLGVMWDARNYTLREDFDAVGPAESILRKLVEPWCLVEPTKVDIWVENTLVIIQARERHPVAPLERTFSIPEALAHELTLTRKRLPFFSRVVLTGMARHGGVVSAFPAGLPFVPAPFPGPSLVRFTETQQVVSAEGVLVSQITTITTKRMPDDIPVQREVLTYQPDEVGGAVSLKRREVTFETWESGEYDEQGTLVNQPLVLFTVTETQSGSADEPDVLRLTHRETAQFLYNADRFLVIKATQKFKLDLDTDVLTERERQLEYHQEQGPNRSIVTLDTYGINEDGALFLKTRQTSEAAGVRPGGVRPPQPKKTPPQIGDTETSLETFGIAPITLIADNLSDDERATELVYSNPHLDENDLRVLMNQIVDANGLFEYEQRLTNTMVQCKKSQAIYLTEIEDADGNVIEMEPSRLFSVLTRAELSGERQSLTTELTARYWKAT